MQLVRLLLSSALVVLALPAQPLRSQTCSGVGAGSDVGRWIGPWSWHEDVCSSYECDVDVHGSIEFYHAGVIPLGLYEGQVVLCRGSVGLDCPVAPAQSQTWIFNPASPAHVLQVHHGFVSGDRICSGHSWDREGRWVFAGGQHDQPQQQVRSSWRFDPRLLLGTVINEQLPSIDPCDNAVYVDGPLAWSQIGDMNTSRYYPSVISLLAWDLPSPNYGTSSCAPYPKISSAQVAIGGPQISSHNLGNEIWELLNPNNSNTQWSCPLAPTEWVASHNSSFYPNIQNYDEPYARVADTINNWKPNPLLDSYPRAVQVSGEAGAQVFVAGDTATITGNEPLDAMGAYPTGTALYPDSTLCWTMKIPYVDDLLNPPGWELWRSDPTEIEHDYGNVVVLARRKDALGNPYLNRILVFGGSNQIGLDHYPTDKVEEYTPGGDAATGQWHTKVNGMLSARKFCNSVVLPDGNIFIVGGRQQPQVGDCGNVGDPQFCPEIYNPGVSPLDPTSSAFMKSPFPVNASTWPAPFTIGQTSPIPRLYHSLAMLLPDARVFVCGGRIYGNEDCVTMLREYPDSRLSGEVFSPPYLFVQGGGTLIERPSITGCTLTNQNQDPSYQQFGMNFRVSVRTPVGSGSIDRVVLVRPASVTHHFDSDQRYIELDYTGGSGSGSQVLVVTAPNRNIAPEGYYMLFALQSGANGKLVPSVAKFIRFLQ
jgi:hypothetical protein